MDWGPPVVDKVSLKPANGASPFDISIAELDRAIAMLMQLRACLVAAGQQETINADKPNTHH
jgi:hypothetical protein